MHITEATLKHLNKAYEVEEGNGHDRDPYLKEMNVRTYLVIDPRVSAMHPFKPVPGLMSTLEHSLCVLDH